MADHPVRFDPDRLPSRLQLPERNRQRVQEAAKEFRRFPTKSEALLWQALRGRKLGVKFRRQHPIGPLIVDFCCPSLRLIVEVDGAVHQQQVERDSARQRLLEDRGYQVVRLRAADVEADVRAAAQRIAELIRVLSD